MIEPVHPFKRLIIPLSCIINGAGLPAIQIWYLFSWSGDLFVVLNRLILTTSE